MIHILNDYEILEIAVTLMKKHVTCPGMYILIAYVTHVRNRASGAK